ncbi:hypothetical protein [Nonomuraea rosea]|uniref:hypothetical protein n=1 Tax=Nonomuraea rosea TaxID=638574 RepID=UPI0031EB2B52
MATLPLTRPNTGGVPAWMSAGDALADRLTWPTMTRNAATAPHAVPTGEEKPS